VLELDQTLGELGPTGAIARERLKTMIESAYEAFWGSESVDPKRLSVSVPLASRRAIKTFLGSFTPTTEEQKQALASVSTLADQITRSRLLMSLQVAGRPVSPGLIFILVLWAVALFFAFGIFAKSNTLVVAAMRPAPPASLSPFFLRSALHGRFSHSAGCPPGGDRSSRRIGKTAPLQLRVGMAAPSGRTP
jgi:hypothetical protein